MNSFEIRHRLRAILVADAVGYSRLMAADDRTTVLSLEKARGAFREHVGSHSGRIIDTAGDSVLATFDTAAGAVAAALAIQQQLRAEADALPESQRMHFRIGVHLGDVIEKGDGTVYGDGVNIAARLQAQAESGAVYVSQAVHDSVSNRIEASFEDLGERQVKNLAKPVRVFRVGHLPGRAAEHTVPVTAVRAPTDVSPEMLYQTNLADAMDPLLGRQSDVDSVLRLLETHRLVTLLGTGGIGKTRLAQEVARLRLDAHTHGVWWIDLSALSTADKIEPAIAQGAHLDLADGAGAAPLVSALRQRDTLLVLDNCEHLVADIARIVRNLHAAAPRVRILATSQEALKLSGEHLYRLEALALPPTNAKLEAARSFSSLQLLEHKARAADPRFELTAETIADAIALCRHLDGVALAIEMAAARLPLLGVKQVHARIGERFRLLRNAERSAPARHRTLQATLDWSHSLLSEAEQAVLRRLSVFAGSFRLDTAQHVAATEAVDAWAVLDALHGLADKSLLQIERIDPPRYRLLETVRLYGSDQLAKYDEIAATLVRHGQAMAGLAGEAGRDFWVTSDTFWWERHAPDIDDMEVAFANACMRRDTGVVGIVGEALRCRDELRLVQSARRQRLAAAYELLPAATGRTAAMVWDWLAASWPVPVPGAPRLEAARRAVAEWQRLDDPQRLCLALGSLAVEWASAGDFDAAEATLSEARRLEDEHWPPRVRHALARNASRVKNSLGDADAYRNCVRAELALAEEFGSEYSAALARFRLADAASMAGDADEAVSLGRAVVMEQRTLFRKSRLGGALSNLCGALLMQGDLAEARVTGAEAWPEIKENSGYGYLLHHLALLAVRLDRCEDAARLLGAADAWYQGTRNVREANEARSAALAGARIVEVLGTSEHARLCAAGARLTEPQIDVVVRSVLRDPNDE